MGKRYMNTINAYQLHQKQTTRKWYIMLTKWIYNAFIALLISAIIALHSLIVHRNTLSIIKKLQERLSYYEYDDGMRKVRCASCGKHDHIGAKYGATWCKECWPK